MRYVQDRSNREKTEYVREKVRESWEHEVIASFKAKPWDQLCYVSAEKDVWYKKRTIWSINQITEQTLEEQRKYERW